MKKIALTFLLILCFGISFSQTYTYRTVSVSTKSDGGQWSMSSQLNVLITVSSSSQRIKIYTNNIQTFDILTAEDLIIDADGDYTYPFWCIDNEGKYCGVRLVNLKSQGGRSQIYVDYKYISVLYNINKVD
jgi:hypothetical protein